jgi:hypothetical protein
VVAVPTVPSASQFGSITEESNPGTDRDAYISPDWTALDRHQVSHRRKVAIVGERLVVGHALGDNERCAIESIGKRRRDKVAIETKLGDPVCCRGEQVDPAIEPERQGILKGRVV